MNNYYGFYLWLGIDLWLIVVSTRKIYKVFVFKTVILLVI